MRISEKECAPTTTVSKRTKSSLERSILNGTHWPFTRVDGKLLERLHRQRLKEQQGQQTAEAALF